MSKLSVYVKDSYNELVNKVAWPSWSELQSSAILVMVASAIFAFVIFVMDYIFGGVMNFLYNALY